MPIYEFECEECGMRFEELVPGESAEVACPSCGSTRSRRVLSEISPPGRQPRGAAVKSDEAFRRERESGHRERLAADKKKRAAGEAPTPAKKKPRPG